MLSMFLMMMVASTEELKPQPAQIEVSGTDYACNLPETPVFADTMEAVSQAWQVSLIMAKKRVEAAKTPQEIALAKAALERVEYCVNKKNIVAD